MKKTRILHFSTHHENCGIGKYNEMFLGAMTTSDLVENDFFETSPNILRVLNEEGKRKVFDKLIAQLKQYDILHIQHEFSFLHSKDFLEIAKIAKDANKKLIITVHTSPKLAYEVPALTGRGPRSIVRFLKQYRRKIIFDKLFTDAVRLADRVIVHNANTKQALLDLGIREARIVSIVLPVPVIDQSKHSKLIHEKLHVDKGDVVMALTGFLHQFKGLDQAVKSLTYLPNNYKLAVIGGMHQDHDPSVYNSTADLIRELKLQDRVYITGYVESDAELNALVRECDMAIYPYDKHYYSNISSASLNNGFANGKPVVAYPTDSFIELNKRADCMTLTQSFAYYELARTIGDLDIKAESQKSSHFARDYSYTVVSKELEDIYINA